MQGSVVLARLAEAVEYLNRLRYLWLPRDGGEPKVIGESPAQPHHGVPKLMWALAKCMVALEGPAAEKPDCCCGHCGPCFAREAVDTANKTLDEWGK